MQFVHDIALSIPRRVRGVSVRVHVFKEIALTQSRTEERVVKIEDLEDDQGGFVRLLNPVRTGLQRPLANKQPLSQGKATVI